MGGREVVIVEFDAAWSARAAALIDELGRAVGPAAERIEHIGSTSIPGMAAKNVLDIQMSVDDLGGATDAIDRALGPLGFVREAYERDHLPAESSDDADAWVKRFWSLEAARTAT